MHDVDVNVDNWVEDHEVQRTLAIVKRWHCSEKKILK